MLLVELKLIELNLISWIDAIPKYDIREWTPDHENERRCV